ncbi:MAG: cytochrome c biogenesis protein CcsA [Candidatus Omnitrophica bacterium]|nr:cytochrome c biogenesis protein CcsA [Candidatus Omnitrophota bacterium]
MTAPLSLFCSMATLYLLGGVVYLLYLATEKSPLLTLGKGIWVIGFICHSLFLGFFLFKEGRLPTAGIFEATTFFAWAVVWASYLSTFRYRIQVLGAFVLPLVFFLILVASLNVHQKVFWNGSFSTFYFGLHTALLFVSYAAFALTFITGFMYLVLERQIKQKTTGRFYRGLPSLDVLEEANGRFLTLGVFLYSLGILFGLLWTRATVGFSIGYDPKVIVSFLTWALYVSLLMSRWFAWVRGRKVMLFSILLFGWVILTFIGVQHPVYLSMASLP